MKLRYAEIASPIGKIRLIATKQGICSLEFGRSMKATRKLLEQRFVDIELTPDQRLDGFVARLKRYLAGEFEACKAIPVDAGGTEFQRKVWTALRRIPAGKTRSYGEIARVIGSPGASRAVGLANGSNPVSIVVPCHRVIGADGSLTGYGGGLHRKEWLLRHEGAMEQAADQASMF